MIQIDRHIEVLLLDNDCVIVPDLGGFMAYHVPARYVKESGQFIPPSRQLGFNAQLKINDSLLAQSYIEAYDISYPEALRRIEAEVEEMHQIIQNTGMCELTDIGVLRLNEQGNMEFEPCEAGILTPGLYGLNILDMLPLTHKVEIDKKPVIDVAHTVQSSDKKSRTDNNSEISETPIVPAPINIVAKDDDDVIASEDDSDDVKASGFNIDIVKRVAGIAAVIISLFIIVMPIGSPKHETLSRSYLDSGFLYNLVAEKHASPEVKLQPKKEVKATEPKKEVKTAEPKAEVKKAEVKAVASNVKDVKAEEKQAAPVKQIKEPSSYYAIVIASCIPHNNATEVAQKLSKSGLANTSVVDRPNGSKVIYGHYASETEARNALRNLRSKDETFAKGWIMKF